MFVAVFLFIDRWGKLPRNSVTTLPVALVDSGGSDGLGPLLLTSLFVQTYAHPNQKSHVNPRRTLQLICLLIGQDLSQVGSLALNLCHRLLVGPIGDDSAGVEKVAFHQKGRRLFIR